ncbi:hypothetical protein APUTEX25_000024 [Auxenochlorella protothecoides]|uniref:Uncharacterized protein n=1 Tax=Auxenochlorella protothecoides TaxID=3075 RepID=A0A3M7KRW3_AUXPR|nr:hypothetical protein APUTEX25_000024 [Auxenochlorella protothecoides]|eukprot:RMZ52445.1 hypothetical protein APUTEX25_000024 [Auxenochlorella protothecoides]
MSAEQEQYIQLPAEAPIYPELLAPGKRCILVGVDPDISGALAVLHWQNPAEGAFFPWQAARLEVHDMPIVLWQLASRVKKQPCSVGLLRTLRPYADLARADGDVVVRAALEVTTPSHISGKHAWFNIGYSTGMLDGILTSLDIPCTRIHAAIWKRQLGLFKKGKPGSMALAHQLLPAAAPFLRRAWNDRVVVKRKKDHGRAEALLIAAWSLGCRAQAVAVAESEDAAGEEDEVLL